MALCFVQTYIFTNKWEIPKLQRFLTLLTYCRFKVISSFCCHFKFLYFLVHIEQRTISTLFTNGIQQKYLSTFGFENGI